jgi:cupin fold WbuC family metalloprotein
LDPHQAGQFIERRAGTTVYNGWMKLFSHDILNDLTAKAAASPRRRAHLNIHTTPSDPVQRFFVVAKQDSYFRPHRHNTKSELAVVLRGYVDVLTFDEAGGVTSRFRVGSDTENFAYETPQNTWHTLMAGTDGATFLEIKEGPYDPATAVEFASWAPAEGDDSAATFQQWLRSAQPGTAAPRNK